MAAAARGRALAEVLASSSPAAWRCEIPATLPGATARVLTASLHTAPLNFRSLDVVLLVLTALALDAPDAVAARLERSNVSGQVAIILFQHTHAYQLGADGVHPRQREHVNPTNVPQWRTGREGHLYPIQLALETLYTLNTRFAVRDQRLPTNDGQDISISSALDEYAEFLHGVIHFTIRSPHSITYLAALRHDPDREPATTPPEKVETTCEQRRRIHLFYEEPIQTALRTLNETGETNI